MSPTVYVIDDDDASREGVALLLETEGHRVRHFADAESFLAAREPEIPGCLVLDQRMPGMNGTDLQAELARRQVRMPIIFLSAFGDVPTTVRAMQGGALDFLAKPVNGPDLLRRIPAALALATRWRAEDTVRQQVAERLATLTAREKQVLTLAMAGRSNKEIGEALGISTRTVEVHRSHVMLKLGVSSLLEMNQWLSRAALPLSEILELPVQAR